MKDLVRGWAAAMLATTLFACASGAGLPENTVAVVSPLTLEPPPIYALLGYRQELRLTSEQVSALDSIAVRAREENRELLRELQERSRDRSRQPGVMVVTPEGEPVLEEIRANQRGAVEAVAEVLDDEQRATVCRLFGGPEGRSPGARRQQRPARDTVADPRFIRPVGWYWCSEGEGSAAG